MYAGLCEVEMRHPDTAVERMRRALEIDPAFQSAHLTLSGLYIQMERYEESIAHAELLVDDPTFPKPWEPLTNKGWALMQLIIDYAKSEGLKTISGDVLQENIVMLEMCRQLGFEVKPDPDEPDICDVRLNL